ncbi:MAG: hypothetical protein SO039_06365, partial [Campylobacter sp.]|nr:hypothetical protein [Campylobacter sp.]
MRRIDKSRDFSEQNELKSSGLKKARNSRIFVIASEAKQSLGILEFSSLRGFKKREQSHLLSLFIKPS